MREEYKIINFEKLTSTNLYAKENLSSLENATVIFAENQENGYGRFKRNWLDFEGKCLTFSIVLKPKKTDFISNLTQFTSCVISSLLKDFDLIPSIKWPNDILIDNAKVGGILCEAKMKNDNLEGIVLGIGINLNLSEDDIKKIDQNATSVGFLINKYIDKQSFLENFLDEFFNRIDDFLNFGFEKIKEEYIKHCDFLGKKVCIKNPEKVYEGIATSINDDGSLNLEIDKNIVVIRNGDLSC